MAHDNAAVTKIVRGQIARRYVDCSMLAIHVSGGVVHLTGIIRPLRTNVGIDLQTEMNTISTILKSKPGIREVVWEVTQRL